MSAEAIGSRLLGEVKEERLDEALKALRSTNSKIYSNKLSIKPLDRLLQIFQGPALPRDVQDTQDNAARSSSPAEHHSATQSNLFQQKPAVIEITGTSSCSGKTHLLYYITTLSILPSSFQGHDLQGKEAAIVIFDTDGRFNVQRLKQVIRHHVHQRLKVDEDVVQIEEAAFNAEMEHLLHSALLHVHIFRPQSSISWLSTIESLPKYLLQSKDHFSSSRSLSAILIDSASAFFWQDRQNENYHKLDTDHPLSNSTFNKVYQNLVKGLRDLQSMFDCTVVATNWGLIPLQQTRLHAPPSFRPHLPSVWTNFCTLRLIVERDSVAKFGPFMSAEEASRDADARQRKVEKGGFSAWVDSASGSEVWNESTRKALKSVEGKGFIWFTITSEGVEMDP